jgi:hypothetical protein
MLFSTAASARFRSSSATQGSERIGPEGMGAQLAEEHVRIKGYDQQKGALVESLHEQRIVRMSHKRQVDRISLAGPFVPTGEYRVLQVAQAIAEVC